MTRMMRAAMLVVACCATSALAADTVAPLRPAIATSNAQATDAGMEVLAAGGNAFDAAVAVSAMRGTFG